MKENVVLSFHFFLFLKYNKNGNVLNAKRKEQTGKHLKEFLVKAQSQQSPAIMCSNGKEHNSRQMLEGYHHHTGWEVI